MDIETIIAYFLLFCSAAVSVGGLMWYVWRDKR
jgi:hypothetical protein